MNVVELYQIFVVEMLTTETMKRLLLLLSILAAVKICSAQSGFTSSGPELAMVNDIRRPVISDTTNITAYNDNMSAPVFSAPPKRPCFIKIRPLYINDHLKLAPPLRVLIAIPAK